uniref:Cellulose synthase 3 n=2 Tax=Pseudoperonospora TaxID=143452 RepID=A0A7D9N3N6_9STRA|nr:cellulose synthase 3 [Pseudoperonospora cubensis]QLB37643.1 cellulose synthase 3 [Pseudoperonospora humuli]
MSLTGAGVIASVVGILGGLSLSCGGWSSLSLGARSLFVTTQFVSAFAMGFVIAFTAIVSLSATNEWVALAAGGGAGFIVALIVGFLTFFGPYILVLVTGSIIAAYLLLFDAHNGINVFPADNQLARQEFVIAFMIIFELVCSSCSKTTELENHRFKYVLFSAITGGWLAADGISRLIDSGAVLSDVAFQSIQEGGAAAVRGMDAGSQTLMFVVWGAIFLVGGLNQLAMRWGLGCYNRVGTHAQLGPVEEQLPELPTGATLPAQVPTERVRLVCENCFATVPSGTAFCTECGEAMPTDDATPEVSISQAQMPSVTMNNKSQAPDRWQQVPHRTFLSTTSFVDPKAAKEGGVSMKDNGRSIRFMDSGVQGPDGKMSQYNDSIAGVRNYYEPSFRSFAMSTYSMANRAAEPVETPNIRKYKMSGSGMFHVFYFGTAATGVVWLYYLTTMYPQEYFCDHARPTLPCSSLPPSEVLGCYSSTVNFDANSGDGYCIQNVPFMSWVMYGMMIFSEFLNFFLGLLFNFSMWRPIRRGARYMNDFKPPIPKEQWPTVDIFLCHYMEPVTDSMQTLKNCLAMQYPPELLHIFVLDDGYTKSVWDANNHFKVTVNTKVIEICGDLRGDLARLMHERVVGPVQDDQSLKSWRRQHSSVRELRKEGGKGVQRRDCAVGSLSDDYDYRDRGIPRVTFIGRMKPETHHSKAGNINNALFNEGADGKYLLILDNDMKPHPKFLLAVLPFFFSEGEAVDGGGRQYSDDISWNQVAYVQTPQYFEDTPQLTIMGDPCGHKNTIFFDAVQCGRDGFDSAAFAGTNAVFRRQAFDSIGGIQYGTQTEDAYTGNILHTSGWDSVYFRKDFEGDAKDRIRLCEGAVPETVAAAMGQKKRWAKGAVQILLMKNESEVDPDWRPPRVPAPDPKPSLAFPRKMFFYDSVLYPFGSIPALCYVSIAVYYLCTGDAPIYARGTKFLYSFLPVTFCRWVLNLLANRAVDNNDVWRAQQTWFSFSFITMMAIVEAIQARMTGKDKSWANTGAGQKTSWTEIPNVLFFFTLLFSQLVALIRFFEYENATNPWNYVSAMFFGFFVMSQFYPMVKMSITEYCGWDHTAATFTANVFGSLLVVYIVVFVQLWQVYYAGNLLVAQGADGGEAATTTTTT